MQCPACSATQLAGRRFCDECGAPLPAEGGTTALQPLDLGAVVGAYRILAPIAGDGSGRCYLAAAPDGRTVRLREAGPEALAAEAAALGAIADPAVAVVLDRIQVDGREMLVTSRPADLVPLAEAGPFATDRAVTIALQLCRLADLWRKAGYLYGDFTARSVHLSKETGGIFLPGAPSTVGLDQANGSTADVHGIALLLRGLLAREQGGILAPDFALALAQGLTEQADERFQTPEAFAAALWDVVRPFRLEVGACTDRGSVREKNQDCVFTSVTGLSGADRERSTGGVFICCDGMGGEAGGEIASGLTVETVGGAMAAFLGTRLTKPPALEGEELTGALRSAVSRANRLLRERVQAEPALFGMGTTITALVAVGDSAVIIHVGDSRGYLYEPGQALRQITRDQSVVGRMVAQGLITEAEARLRPDRNLLWQAVGTRDQLEPEVSLISLRPGQKFLLVSDGVHGFVASDRLAAILAEPLDPGAAANLIVNTALASGSDDNCSAVVVAVCGRAR